MKKHFFTIAPSLFFLTGLLMLPYFVFAANIPSPMDRLQNVAVNSGYSSNTTENTLISTIGGLVNMVLGLLGVIFISLMIYAGFVWLTAAGNETKVSNAIGIIKTSIIGLIVILSSWAIWTFLLQRFIS